MIKATKLRKQYPGGVEAVKGIDFEVSPGEVFALLGPNGAGKSTTVGMLTGTVKPTGGSATVAGFDVATQPLEARKASSVVFQDAVIDRSLSGRQNLDIHARLWGVDQRFAGRRIAELAGALGLSGLVERPVGTYSGGERRRLEIARALVSDPRVLFLDEPTVGLDPRIRAELLDIVRGLREQSGLTILVTTHYLDEAELLCDRVAIIHAGKIVALGTPQELRAGLGREIVEVRVEGDGGVALTTLRARGLADDNAFTVGSTVTMSLNGHSSGEVVAAVQELGLARAVSARQPTLDDVYLRLTGGRLAEAA